MPIGYRDYFSGQGVSIWILLKSGTRLWPVRVVNNRFCNGWARFVRDHVWSSQITIVFGVEKKWIFEVSILDVNLERIVYPWTHGAFETDVWQLPPGLVLQYFLYFVGIICSV